MLGTVHALVPFNSNRVVRKVELNKRLTMKKINLLGLLLGVAIAPAALANTLTLIDQTPGASYGDGGELTVSSSPALSGYSRSAGTIQTFCIETGVPISIGGTYNYTLTLA